MGVKNTSLLNPPQPGRTTKFNLFLKNHEIKQVNAALKNILLMSRDKREEWIAENGEIVQSAFNTFIDDSNVVLDNLSLDEDIMELSQELVISLKDTMEIVDSILSEEQALES